MTTEDIDPPPDGGLKYNDEGIAWLTQRANASLSSISFNSTDHITIDVNITYFPDPLMVNVTMEAKTPFGAAMLGRMRDEQDTP
jgi:predicted NAD-dependent protein-ADP-ribosyltransferase YbiA (DUF1768 family)